MSELCPPCGTSGNPSMGPYQRHYYRLGSVIRNTVSQAQELLCGIWRHQLCDGLRFARDYFEGLGAPGTREEKVGEIEFHDGSKIPMTVTKVKAKVQSVGLPQSLGELCIELARDNILRLSFTTWKWVPFVSAGIGRDIQKLRETMYHKHTDPKQERLYRLIDKVRNT